MKRNNTLLLVLVLLLLVVNLAVFNIKPGMTRLAYAQDELAVRDTTAISYIEMASEDWRHRFSRLDNWRVSGAFEIDEGFRQILFAVLSRVRISRQASLPQGCELPIEVQVGLQNGDRLLYTVCGNATKTKTYFITPEEEVYEMEIPGYRDYVAGIFELSTTQWRNRMVFDGNWRSIQQLDVRMTKNPGASYTIQFRDSFFEVSGLDAIDSTAVVEYLNEFEYLQANERIMPGQVQVLDSLAKTAPEVVLILDDIKREEALELRIFPVLGTQPYQLVMDGAGEMMIFDRNRVENLVRWRKDLAY